MQDGQCKRFEYQAVGRTGMTLDELAKLVRDTAKGMNLTLEKVICRETKVPLSIGVKAKPGDRIAPYVCFEIVNGMKMGRRGVDLKAAQAARAPRELVSYHLGRAAEAAGLEETGPFGSVPVWTKAP